MRSGILLCVHEVLYADARLTENALERANDQVTMHRHRDAPVSSRHPNMRTGLPGNREAQALQSFECFGSRDVPGQFHARTKIGSLTKWIRMRRGPAPSSK